MPGLSHDLETLRRRARRLVFVRGAAALLATVLGFALLLGSIDSLVRWQSPTQRLAQTCIWVAAIIFVGWRFLIRPLRARLSNQELAQIIHRQWPTQTPDLTSAVDFECSQLSATVGAPLLQQVTVSRAQHQLATVPWQSVVVQGRVYAAVASAVLAAGLLGLAVVRSSEMTGVGACRLASPWLDLDWPRHTTLVYLNSDLTPIDTSRDPAVRAGQGDPLTLYIENRTGALPTKVIYKRKTLAGENEQGELRQTTLRDSQGRPHQVAVASLPTTEPFEFRAQGGDDDRAPWITVNVVPPPRVQSFEIELTPPAYTGKPTETLTSGVGHLQGLVGSQVHIRCRAAAPLQAAWLNTGNAPRQTLSLGEGGLEFTLEWAIAAAERSTYWIDLTDPYGLRASSPPRYEIRGVADQEPVVTLLIPTSDLRVTPQAAISLSGEARDDLGLQRVELAYEPPQQAVTSPSQPEHLAVEQQTVPLGPELPGALEQKLQTTWNLSELALQPGAQVRFWLQATDACNLNGLKGQVGRSAVRVISIVSTEDKQLELSGQQIQIAERIIQLRDQQAALEQSTQEIVTQWKSVGSLRPSDELELERVQSEQQAVAQELGHSSQGVLGDLQSLQKERSMNQLNDPPTSESLSRWESTLSPVADEVLPSVLAQLEAARRGADQHPGSKTAPGEQTTKAMEQAHSGQLRALDDLSRLATELAQWRRDEDLDKRFAEIVNRQASLREQSLEVGQQTSAKTLADLSSQEQADLARAADRQGSLAREVEQLTTQLEAVSPPTVPQPGTDALAGMAQQLTEMSVAATMRGVSDALRQNHVQSATDTQQKLIDSLDALRQGLDQQRSQTKSNDIEELRKSIANADELAERQAELRRRTAALSAPSADSNRAAESGEAQRLQRELEDQTAEFAQRLQREHRNDSSTAAQRASQRMHEARESLEQEQVTQSLDRQTEAIDELEQVQNSLDEDLQDANQRADQERLNAVAQLVVALRERAKTTRAETIRVEELRLANGKWTRGQLKSVQLVANSQRDIAKSCEQAAQQLGSNGVLRLCIDLASEHFTTAAQHLDERDAGQITQAEQRSGETLLDQFIASLNTSNPPAETPDSPETQPPATEQGEPPQPSSPLMAAEVRLLLRMQEELLARTRVLADLKSNGHDLTADQVSELHQLRDRQKRLVKTARSMIGKSSESESEEVKQP